jgi:hypothetical protein
MQWQKDSSNTKYTATMSSGSSRIARPESTKKRHPKPIQFSPHWVFLLQTTTTTTTTIIITKIIITKVMPPALGRGRGLLTHLGLDLGQGQGPTSGQFQPLITTTEDNALNVGKSDLEPKTTKATTIATIMAESLLPNSSKRDAFRSPTTESTGYGMTIKTNMSSVEFNSLVATTTITTTPTASNNKKVVITVVANSKAAVEMLDRVKGLQP